MEHLIRNMRKKKKGTGEPRLKNRPVTAFIGILVSLMWCWTPVQFHVLFEALVARIRETWLEPDFIETFCKIYCRKARVPQEQREQCGLEEYWTADWHCGVVSRSN